MALQLVLGACEQKPTGLVNVRCCRDVMSVEVGKNKRCNDVDAMARPNGHVIYVCYISLQSVQFTIR